MAHIMAKIPDCDRCRFFASSPYLVCALHPGGPETDICPDYSELDFQTTEEEDPDPMGWFSDDWQPALPGTYLGKTIAEPNTDLSTEDQLALLDWHPIFTGRCPECEMPILPTDPPRIYWDCEHCDWRYDSV